MSFGLDGEVFALSPFVLRGPGVYVGGDFTTSGGRNSIRIARWGCPSVCPCACDFDTNSGPGVCDIVDFVTFAGLFAGGDPCACDMDTSTGPGVCDIVDFTTFAGQFAGGCPRSGPQIFGFFCLHDAFVAERP